MRVHIWLYISFDLSFVHFLSIIKDSYMKVKIQKACFYAQILSFFLPLLSPSPSVLVQAIN